MGLVAFFAQKVLSTWTKNKIDCKSVFFNLFWFRAPCKTGKKIGGTLTWLK